MDKQLIVKLSGIAIMIFSAGFGVNQLVGNNTSNAALLLNGTVTGIGETVSPLLSSIVTAFGAAVGGLALTLLSDYFGNRDWRRRHGENHTPVVAYP